jgi:hypothetical protein
MEQSEIGDKGAYKISMRYQYLYQKKADLTSKSAFFNKKQ